MRSRLFWTLANADFVESTARNVNVASAMIFQFAVLMFDVNEPAVQLLRWHGEHLACKFTETIRESIHGEEVGGLPAVK